MGDETLRTCQVLPKEVQSFVRSGLTVTSVAQCVEELVQNSIDAQASKVFVGVNLDNFNIRVEDDGTGASKENLAIIGTRYATSKCRSVDDLKALKYYGYRGEGLASIIEVSSYVEITSMTQRFCGSYKRKFSKGKPTGNIEKGPDFKKKTSGFIISVENLLSALPVRQNRAQKSIEQEEIKSVLQRLCLINPGIVVECRNDATTSIILKYRGSKTFAEAFSDLYGKNFSLIQESYLHDSYFFSAFVTKELHRSKAYQFVYVNRRFIGRGKVHRILNDRFYKMLSQTGKNSGGQKYPVFLVNIKCALNLYDITLEPRKSAVEFRDFDAVIKGLDGLLLSFQSTFNSLSDTSLNLLSESFSKNDKNKKQDTSLSKKYRYNSKSEESQDFDANNVGLNVTTHDVKGALHSRFATRDGDEGGVPDLPVGLSQLSSPTTLSSTSPEKPMKTQQREEKATPVLMNLKTARKRLMVDVTSKGRKRRSNADNIFGQNWHPRKKVGQAIKPKITKNIFKNFPEWKRGQETSSLSGASSASVEVIPTKKVKSSELTAKVSLKYPSSVDPRVPRATATNSKTKDHDLTHEEVDNLQWKMTRYLRDSQDLQDKKTTFKNQVKSTLPSNPDPETRSCSLSFVESISSSPVLRKNKVMEKETKGEDKDSFKAIKTLYSSQSPSSVKVPEKNQLNDSVEIIEVAESNEHTPPPGTSYIKETLAICENLKEKMKPSSDSSFEYLRKPLASNVSAMSKTEGGKNLIKLLIRDFSKERRTTQEFRVRAPSVEVEYMQF